MTPADALNLIDQVCARFTGTREDHVNLQQAIAVLREATAPKAEPVLATQEVLTAGSPLKVRISDLLEGGRSQWLRMHQSKSTTTNSDLLSRIAEWFQGQNALDDDISAVCQFIECCLRDFAVRQMHPDLNISVACSFSPPE